MRVLYIGGTGEISYACVEHASRSGHEVSVFNRGQRQSKLPSNVEHIQGDMQDKIAYSQLANRNFDVVCQFLAFDVDTVQRDIALFSGHCKQYIFISTASAYQKPSPSHIISEATPLDNPHWAYSRNKAACEVLLNSPANKLPVTIIRPSHTYRTKLPSTVIDGDHLWWRLSNNKPIIIHGDGESLWTLTHSEDFAKAFVALCGNEQSINETFQITDSDAYTWNHIIRSVANLMECTPSIQYVTSTALTAYNADWIGPLLGDKSNSMIFDNRKIEHLTNGWRCQVSLETGLENVRHHVIERMESGYEPDPILDALIDKIIEDQFKTQH